MIRIKLPFQIKIYLLLFLLFGLLVYFTTRLVNRLTAELILQNNIHKFEELKSVFYNLLGYKLQSIENEAFLLADQASLRDALTIQEMGIGGKAYQIDWLPGSQRRDLVVITDKNGKVIDGSITLKNSNQSETVRDTTQIQQIMESWRQMEDVLLGYDSFGYIVVTVGKTSNLFAIASTPVTDAQQKHIVLGTVSVGFTVDQSMAQDLRRGSFFQIGFIFDDRIVTSTFGQKRSIDFRTAWDEMPPAKKTALLNKAEEIDLFSERFLAYAAPLPTQGPTKGLYVILSPMTETFNLLERLNQAIIHTSLWILAIVLVIAYILAKSVTSPVSALANAVSLIAEGKYDIKVSMRTGDELETLGTEIHKMALTIKRRNQQIQDYIKQIEEWNKELENRINERTRDLEEKNFRLRMISEELGRAYARIDDELKVVGELQKRLLPKRAFETKGITFRSVYIPNGRAGGDYYDYLTPQDKELFILIADVSGHGTPAAFIMGITRAMAHTLIEQKLSPREFLCKLSDVLLRTLRSGEFITMFIGRLNLETLELQYSSAGHQPPLLLRHQTGEYEELKVKHGLPLGILEDTNYDQVQMKIEPGDRLLLYTDGIIEAFNESKKPYGIEQLGRILRDSNALPPDDLLETILDDLESFVQHPLDIEPLEDDVTIVVIDFHRMENDESLENP